MPKAPNAPSSKGHVCSTVDNLLSGSAVIECGWTVSRVFCGRVPTSNVAHCRILAGIELGHADAPIPTSIPRQGSGRFG